MRGDQKDAEMPDKKLMTDALNFQMDGNGVVDTNKFCDLCNMIFSSPVVAQSHYVGKIHARKLKHLSGDQAQTSPLNSQPNKDPTAMPSATPESQEPKPERPSLDVTSEETSPSPSSPSTNTLDSNDPEKNCELCSASFNSPLMAQQHYVGKKHKRNEARKKMMEEIGPGALPEESSANALGVGYYVCPICSITLTSMEMYQAHLQGNKHQIKETLVVNLMKNSKQTYDSFQDELADYIKVQKARGLEPNTYFRKAVEELESYEYEEEGFSGHEDGGFDRTLPFERFEAFPEACTLYRTVENRPPHRSAGQDNQLRLESLTQCQFSKDSLKARPPHHEDTCGPSGLKSEDAIHISLDNRSSSYRVGQKFQREHHERKRHREEGEEKESDALPKQKRKMLAERGDPGKDHHKMRKRRTETDSVDGEKSKHRKGKRNQEVSTDKGDRKHRRDKKKETTEGRTEEEMLWDESILGF
ncbi:lysine-rich coiled-coil protein 1 isoform X2 [Ornithorhynchus anatinus]|nr:lysine-rich coiled-coil protein 1 isoform X2 [Ornithorhynchus anatinus]